ncbi:MAG: hypothetical protein H6922_05600 [Pseudomonadaceae bacterium]|nr:hypothetical protein [Pseudomonadaceae bacterium]
MQYLRLWHCSTLLIAGVLAAMPAYAGITVGPSNAQNDTNVSRETNAEASAEAPQDGADTQRWRQQVEQQWKDLIAQQQKELAPADVLLFLHARNYNARTVMLMNEMALDPAIMALKPEAHLLDDGDPMAAMDIISDEMLPELNDGITFYMAGKGAKLAKSFGVGLEDTLVYRDSTGAVRLYILPYDLPKFKDQLARAAAKPQTGGQ